jgi:peptidase E
VRRIAVINILLSQYNFNEEWARATIRKYINDDDKVVVIPFAFSEKWISNNVDWHNAYSRTTGKYYREIVEPFMDLGISEDDITWLNFFEDTDADMKRIIEKCKIVFLTGGLPEMAVKRVLEMGLLKYMDESKVIMGASAGALMQLNNYYISPDEDYPEFMYSQGLGLVNSDFYIEVHYEESYMQNQCIEKVLKESTDTVYAIKENGGIIIENNKILLLGDVVTFKNNN